MSYWILLSLFPSLPLPSKRNITFEEKKVYLFIWDISDKNINKQSAESHVASPVSLPKLNFAVTLVIEMNLGVRKNATESLL